MKEEEFKQLVNLSDRELFDYITEKDSSQRKWVAQHLLELRRNRELTQAAKSSARAAWLAAIIAGISAVIAVVAYLHI
jgi:succinate dehydrogenase flavin-adding protein (antitoxin of CptAB toxin-antitoxin module)